MEKPTAEEAAAYRNGMPSRRLNGMRDATLSAPGEVKPARAERDEEQPEQEADRQRPAAARQRQRQDQHPEADDHHREDPDGELVALVRRWPSAHAGAPTPGFTGPVSPAASRALSGSPTTITRQGRSASTVWSVLP